MSDFLLYGATGYTGELIARAAVDRGLRPRLAGRNGERVARLADELGLEWRAGSLDEPDALAGAFGGLPLVLHCAGPFRVTSRPVADACLRHGVHYLDLTGEIGVFEALAARDAEARAAGVMLLPGVGFDLVPTDCLAAHVKRRLPTATHLAIALQHLPWRDHRSRWRQPSISHGTLATLLDSQVSRGVVRRDGVLTPVSLGRRARRIDLGRGPTIASELPLGEVSATYHSTGIPNIDAYVALPLAARAGLRYLTPILPRLPLRPFLPRGGPSSEELAASRSLVWAEARDPAGQVAVSRLHTPGGYALTVEVALRSVARVLAGQAPAGYQTPSTAFGADFVLEVPGVERFDDAPYPRGEGQGEGCSTAADTSSSA